MNPIKRFLLLCSLSLFVLVLPVFIQQLQKTQFLLDQAAVLNGPPPLSSKQFTLLPPGSMLPSGTECTQRVRRTTWEPRPENNIANKYIAVKGTDYTIEAMTGVDPRVNTQILSRVDGNFSGTTDEIIQWASCKWGFDEELLRGMAVVESWWTQSTSGCEGDCYGLFQERAQRNRGFHPAIEKSTAFNADVSIAKLRACYEGYYTWLNGSGYRAGDMDGCLGQYVSGSWNAGQEYIARVKSESQARQWATWGGTQVTNGPTLSVFLTPTTPVTGKKLTLTLSLHGLGKGGDNVNGQATGNMQPLRQQRPIELEFFNSSNVSIGTRQGSAVYNTTTGTFMGTVDIANVPSDQYTLKIKLSQFLKRSIPGIISVPAGNTAIQIAPFALVTGDVNDDNRLSILDYNVILDCFSDLTPAKNCADTSKKQRSDITDDGNVNQFDYNLFLRELSVQLGS